MHTDQSTQVRRHLAGIMIGSTTFALIAIWALFSVLSASAQPLDRPQLDPPWNGDVAITHPADSAAGLPAVAASGDTVWAGWAEANNQPYLVRSTDAGASWSTPTAVAAETPGDFKNRGPVLTALSSSTVEIAWYTWNYYADETIYFKRSTDGGQTWGPERVVRGPALINLEGMALAAKPDGHALIVWRESTNKIVVARSANDGATWSSPVEVRNAWVADKPALAFSPSGNAHLVWTENEYGLPSHIFYARSSNNGAAWSGPVDISQSPANTQAQPSIAVDSATGDIHVAWAETRTTGSGIYHTVSNNDGANWSTPQLISGSSGTSSEPAITAWTSGVLYTVWQDTRLGQPDILFSRSTDRGLTWNGGTRVNTAGSNAHMHPGVASGSNVFPVWQDDRNGKNDIFTTRLISSCAVPLESVNILGDSSVLPGATLALTGSFTPSNATLPITLNWSPAPLTGQGTLSSTYRWAEPGLHTVTFSTSNCGGSFSVEHPVVVTCPAPVTGVTLSGPTALAVGATGTFTAQVSPASPYQPVSYLWSPAPNSGQGSSQATYLWQDVGEYNVTVTSSNCSAMAGEFQDSQSVTVSDTQAPTWGTFTPSGWTTTTQAPALTIQIQDSESGLNPASGQYQYTRNGGGTWFDWTAVTISGAEHATTPQTIAVTIPWGQDSGPSHANRVRFRAADMAGNQSTSPDINVDIDTTPPVQPTSVSGNRTTSTWSNLAAIQMTWSGGSDASSGVRYLTLWDQNSGTVPQPGGTNVVTTSASPLSTSLPGDGKWYFHLRARDLAGNLAASAVQAGPYWLDTAPPANPVIYSSDPLINIWTANRPVQLHYGGSSDPGGSGIAGYSFQWSNSATTNPNTTLDSDTSLWTLADGSWYFHVWAKDNAGNWTAASHYGPILLDMPPTIPSGLSASPQANTWIKSGTVGVSWTASSDNEGTPVYSTRWDWGAPQTPDCKSTTTALNWTSPAVSPGRWYFSVRARNLHGLCSPAATLGPFKIDQTAPTNPLYLDGWKNTPNTVQVNWGNASDWESGVRGYTYLWSPNANDSPVTYSPTQALTATSPGAPDGNLYFSIRTVDNAGNWSAPARLGPFFVDGTPPSNPTSFTANQPLSTWVSGYITVNWSGASDGAGSGIDGYSVEWSDSPNTLPAIVYPTQETSSTASLSNGDSHYIHVRTRDKFGNWSPSAAHYGPFWLDHNFPTCSINPLPSVSNKDFTITWAGNSSGSPILNYDLDWRTPYGASTDWTSGYYATTTTSANINGADGLIYDFRCRARSAIGAGDWSSYQTVRVATLDISAYGLEVTQGVQDLANSIPLITNKHAYVRLHVKSSLGNINQPVTARLEVWSSGDYMGSLAPINDAHGVKQDPNRGLLNDGFTFDMPTEWTNTGHLWLVAEVNPDGHLAESDYANNTFQVWPHMMNAQALCLVMLSVIPNTANPDPFFSYTTDDPSFWDNMAMLRRFLPLSDGGTGFDGLRIYKKGAVGPPPAYPYNLTQQADWERLRHAVGAVDSDTTNPCGITKYVGMVSSNVPFGNDGIGDWPGNDSAAVMYSAVSNTSVPPGRWGGVVIAHELGHNFGRTHVLCRGDEGDPDPDYPYQSASPNCQIGKAISGVSDQTSFYDTFRPYSGNIPVIVPPVGVGDLMSYDGKRGISDYTYGAFLGPLGVWGGGNGAAPVQPAKAAWSSSGDYLTVSGLIDPSAGTVQFDPFYRKAEAKPSTLLESYNQIQVEGAPYSLTMEAADRTVLYSYPFNPSLGMDITGASAAGEVVGFFLTLPYHPDTVTIRLHQGATLLGSRPVSAHAPLVSLQSPSAGQSFSNSLTVSWTGSDQDLDPLTYIVRYSPDGGATWSVLSAGTTSTSLTVTDTTPFAGSTQAKVQVIASDGVNTSSATSAAFSLARHAPEVHIYTPTANAHYLPGALITFEAAALDAEDGWIDGSSQINWASNLSGALGSGAVLSVATLPVGTHTITVTVRDSDNNTATASVTLIIGNTINKLYLPLVRR